MNYTVKRIDEGPAEPPRPAGKHCPACDRLLDGSREYTQLRLCRCGHHDAIPARARIDYLVDQNTFQEVDARYASINIIDFEDYDKKLKTAEASSGEKDAVICGYAAIDGVRFCLFAMEPMFMMGSMGSVVGEKITLLFERARREGLPVIGFCVSGGARLQEGVISLMQMAKVSAALKAHSSAGGLYIAVLCNPTLGGVMASFAAAADIIVAEPGATIGFAGKRVIEQAINAPLPPAFQSAEQQLARGAIDLIVSRREQRRTISRLLLAHRPGQMGGGE